MGKMLRDFCHYDLHLLIEMRMVKSMMKTNETMIYFLFSIESAQSKQTRVSFEQTTEPKERYECTFAAYLEVRIVGLDSLISFVRI